MTTSSTNSAIYVYNNVTYHINCAKDSFLMSIDHVDCKEGDEIVLSKIYDQKTGFVPVEKQKVIAVCVEPLHLGVKVWSYKFRRRIGWALKRGFRPQYTVIRIGGK